MMVDPRLTMKRRGRRQMNVNVSTLQPEGGANKKRLTRAVREEEPWQCDNRGRRVTLHHLDPFSYWSLARNRPNDVGMHPPGLWVKPSINRPFTLRYQFAEHDLDTSHGRVYRSRGPSTASFHRNHTFPFTHFNDRTTRTWKTYFFKPLRKRRAACKTRSQAWDQQMALLSSEER